MNNPRTVTVTENATYTAIFSEKPDSTFTITIYFDENQGFILGAGTYAEGSIATIAAIPADDYEFVKWSDGVTDNPREIVVNQDIVLAAFFNTTGVDENGNYILSLYPIPTRDKLHIEGLEAATEVEVYSAQGQLVKRTTLSGDGELYVAELPAGLYFVRVGRYSLKFVKQ